ncbi:unnamed protein product [Brachionus calyciflorus]|uniref:BTB domain-containing protein n=1 Tax=Brachionus calyciflorus TaxID=104777 RepID=A0A813MD41_9BILA|nr:unnamed protein product [Brachionus calyciflorus]
MDLNDVNICELNLNATNNSTNGQAKGQLYTNPKYNESFFIELRRLNKQRKYTDVQIICSEKSNLNTDLINDKIIYSHKLVLACLSPYFDTLFSSNFDESKTNKVYMPQTDYDTLLNIVNYAYTGDIELNVHNVQNIFCLANLLQIESLTNISSEFMDSNLDVLNCLEVLKFSKQYSCEYLEIKSREFIHKNFVDILKLKEFVEFSDGDILIELFNSDQLDVPNEEILLDSLLKWTQFKLDERKNYFKKIFLDSIRLSLIEPEILSVYINENKDFIQSCFTDMNLITDLVRPKMLSQVKKRSGMAKAEQCFLLVGGNCDLDDGTYVNCFNPFNGEKYFLSKSYAEKIAFSDRGYFHIENPGVCVTNENRIFIAGGVLVFHQYKTSKQQSSPSRSNKTANQNSSHDDFRLIFSDPDSLRDGDETLSKELYEYDISHNKWLKRSNMLFAKANFSLCALNNERIYSFGGISTGQIPLDIVESYDVIENKWCYVGTMPSAFVAGCVVEYEKNFYVLGGRSGVGRHDSCYLFKPDINEWTEIASLKIGRFNFGACVHQDRIYTFGGQRYAESREHYFTREALDSVEIYNLKTNEWTWGPKMPAPLYNTGICIYEDNKNSIYLCGTTECQFSGTTLFGFMFTSVFRLDFENDMNETSSSNSSKSKWTIVEHDVSDIKAYYRCISAKINSRKLHKLNTQI